MYMYGVLALERETQYDALSSGTPRRSVLENNLTRNAANVSQ